MEVLKQAEDLLSAKISVIKTLLTIIRLESKLAGLSVIPLILNLCMLFAVLITFWLFTSLLIGYGILLVTNNISLTLVLVFLFNLAVLWALARYLAFNIKNISFEKTRAYLFQHQDVAHEYEKKIKSRNSNHDSPLTPTANSSKDASTLF